VKKFGNFVRKGKRMASQFWKLFPRKQKYLRHREAPYDRTLWGTALFFGALYLLFVTVHPAVDSSKVIPNFQANTTIVLPTE
jgi:hypothetical protein